MGGEIHLNSQVESLISKDNVVDGVVVDGNKYAAEQVVSTVPLPITLTWNNSLSSVYQDQVKSLRYLGVFCVAFLLKQPLTNNFWLNINDSEIPLSGIIEYSNLNPSNGKHHLVYVPYYTTQLEEDMKRGKEYWIDTFKNYFKKINKEFDHTWIEDVKLFSTEYAQPVCFINFSSKIPPIKTPLDNFYAVDNTHFFPEDRSFDECVKLANKLINKVRV